MGTGEWVLAVDLGTTKTRAAYTAPGSREPVAVKVPPEYTDWLPSSVARDPDAGGWLVGRDAERLRTGWTGAFQQNAKLLLGQGEPHYFDGHPFSVLELVAQPLVQVAMIARAQAGHVFDRLALAAPVQFEEYRKDLLIQAGEMAGFPTACISVTTEAEAATRAALGPRPQDGTWLLFDMGGGTLDVALLRSWAGRLEILDTFGTDEVSGYVLDTAIMEHLRTEYSVGPAVPATLRTRPAASKASESATAPTAAATDGQAREEAEQWRETLLRDTAELAKTGVTLRGPGRATLPDPHLRVVLSANTLRKLAGPVIARALNKCGELLDENGMQWPDLTAIVCTGGSTRGPVIRELVADQGVPIRDAAGTPELAVVHGLLAPQIHSRAFYPNTIQSTNAASVRQLRTLPHSAQVRALAFSPSGTYLATASGNVVQVWDPLDGTQLWEFTDHTDPVTSLAFAPGDVLASGSTDQTVRLRTLGHEGVGQVFQAGAQVHSLAFSSDGSRLAVGGADSKVHVLASDTGVALIEPLTGHDSAVVALASAPEGFRLAAAAGSSARIWDAAEGAMGALLTGHASTITALAFSPDSLRVVTASRDKTLGVYDPRRGVRHRTFQKHTDYVRSVAFSPTGELVASGDDQNTVRVWNPETGDELVVLSGHNGYVWSVAFSQDGTLLATGDNGQVMIWGLS